MKMTKKDLINAIKALSDDASIVLASDEEGNTFGLLWSVEVDKEHNAAILWPASGTVEVEDN